MTDEQNKYFIRLNSNNQIIHYFSNIFEKPLETDIEIGQGYGSQFRASSSVLSEELQVYANVENGLSVHNLNGLLQYKFEKGIIYKLTDAELQEQQNELPPAEPTELEKLQAENTAIKQELEEQKQTTLDLMQVVAQLYEATV